jgi:hypothetical protein
MLNLVTDRTQSDVDRYKQLRSKINTAGWAALSASEKVSWLNTKGEYRYTDLNRVGSALQYLAELLSIYGYPVTVTARTNLSRADIPRQSDMQAYLGDVVNIKGRFYGSTFLPATMDHLSFADANSIELLLLEIEAMIDNMIGNFQFSGGFYCGSDLQIQLLTGVI